MYFRVPSLLLLLILYGVELGATKSLSEKDVKEVTYTAVVSEYQPYHIWSDEEGGAETLRANALHFANDAATAKSHGGDILITPEYGLQSLQMHTENISEMITYSQFVPDPADQVAPYKFNTSNMNNVEALAILSWAAFDNSIYMVVGLSEVVACSEKTATLSPFDLTEPSPDCPESGYIFYNTQVVFDRLGIVIARYRKQNLFGGEVNYFAPGPEDDESALFDTDFGVAFSLQICFDVLFEHPGRSNILRYGVKDVAMSTAWVDELPFALADESHNAFGHGLGVNLLVSGYHAPAKGKLGSGIYKWYEGGPPNYIYNKNSPNTLLFSNVTTIPKALVFDEAQVKSMSPHPRKAKSRSESIKYIDDVREVFLGYQKEFASFASMELGESSAKPGVHAIAHSDLSTFASVPLVQTAEDESISVKACHGDFCCSLTYSHPGSRRYMLLVFHGTLYAAGTGFGSQICSVAWCRDENTTSCATPYPEIPVLDDFGPFEIRGTFSSSRITVVPEGLAGNYELLDRGDLFFEYDSGMNEYVLKSEVSFSNTFLVGLYGRWYPYDLDKAV